MSEQAAPEGVPVVDLTGTLAGLHEHADQARTAAREMHVHASRLEQLARSHARQAEYLDALAAALEGMTP